MCVPYVQCSALVPRTDMPWRRPDMTAPAGTVPDLTALDRHIAEALADLRLARGATTRSRNTDTLRVEEIAESQLNGLLECRHAHRR